MCERNVHKFFQVKVYTTKFLLKNVFLGLFKQKHELVGIAALKGGLCFQGTVKFGVEAVEFAFD